MWHVINYSSNTVYLLIYAAQTKNNKVVHIYPAAPGVCIQSHNVPRYPGVNLLACVWQLKFYLIHQREKKKKIYIFPTRLVCIINWSLTTIVYSLETGFVVAVVCCCESRDWIRLVIVRHSVTWEALIISREQAWCFVIEIRKNILGWPGNKDGLWFYRHFPKKIKRHLTRIGVDLPSNGKLKKKVFSFVQIFFSRWQYILPCTVNNLMLYDITWRCIETSVSAGWRFPLFFFRSVGRPLFCSAIFLASSFFRFFFYFPHLAVTSLVFIPSRPVYSLFFLLSVTCICI